MLIAQLTDIHIKPDGRVAYGGQVDTLDFLRASVAHLLTLETPLDGVIVSGDLTDDGALSAYALIAGQLSRLPCPVAIVPGNHDVRDAMRTAYPDQPWASTEGPLHGVWEVAGWRLVGLDSSIPGESGGRLGDAGLAWLAETLAEAPDTPTLVFLHHPPFLTGIRHMDVQNLADGEAFLKTLAAAPQVKHVACGHVHRAITAQAQGVALSIAPSPAHAVTLDLDPAGAPSFMMEPPMVRLFHAPAGGGPLVTHLSPVGRFSGPHAFFDADGGLVD